MKIFGTVGFLLKVPLFVLVVVILYHSVVHKKCPPQSGYVQAHLKSGGYVITPVNQGEQSIVKHMLAIDWKFWKFYLCPSAGRSLTISMLERVAALRELFKGKQGNYSSKCLSMEWLRRIHLPQTEKTDNNMDTEEDDLIANEVEKADEFFDVPEASEFTDVDRLESEWNTEPSSELCAPNSNHPELTSAAGFVRKLHDITTQKKDCMDLQEVAKEDTLLYCYGNSLQKDPTSTLPCSWSAGDLSWFLILGKSYLQDNQKIKANGSLMQMVGADWLISDKREDDLGSRLGGIVQGRTIIVKLADTNKEKPVQTQVPTTAVIPVAMAVAPGYPQLGKAHPNAAAARYAYPQPVASYQASSYSSPAAVPAPYPTQLPIPYASVAAKKDPQGILPTAPMGMSGYPYYIGKQ